MTLLRRSLVVLSSLLLASIPAAAQVAYTGGTYTQNFDTLPVSGTTTLTTPSSATGLIYSFVTDVGAAGMPGWSFIRHFPATTSGTSRFSANDGGSNTGSAFSYGTGTATERALGAVGSGSNASRFGVAFTNNTGATITEFTLTYTGEQWRRGTATTDRLMFSYAVGASTIAVPPTTQGTTTAPAGFTGQAALDYISPMSGAAGATDGNSIKQTITSTVTGISWGPGQTLVLQWTDRDDVGSDDGLAIDDLAFTTPSAPPTGTVPTIDTPPSNQTVTEGTNAQFTVAASGTAPLSYQWRKVSGANQGPLSDGVGISGSQTATLTLTGVALADAGNYEVEVTNTLGSAIGGPATLTVSPLVAPPTIDTPPASQTITVGTTVQFTVAASGPGPLSYQWHKVTGANSGQLSNTGNISGALTDTLTLTSATLADAGTYKVVVSNAGGSVDSPAASLTVNPVLVPPSITTQPVSQVVAPGGSANFTVAATGTAPLTYQWRRNGVALANGPTIVGANTSSLTISSVTADAAGAYDVVVSGVSPSATSNVAMLSVSSLITPTSQIAYAGGTYAQSFDTLPASGTFTLTSTGPLALDAAPINATGLAGWSLAKYAGSGLVALFQVGAGGGTSGAVFSLGTGSTPERALGSLSSGSTVSRFGATLVNSTGQTITQFTVSYTGEQWRRGTAAANKLAFEYAFDATNLNAGTFIAASALDFTAPNTTGSGVALNGNDPINRAQVSATVSGLNWAPGQVLVLRWTDVDDSGSDDALAIDNLAFSTPIATTAILPAVVYTAPANGAVNIATNAPISVTFNEAVNFTNSSFTLTGSTSGAHTATLSGGPQSYTLTPNTSFAEGEDVTLTILAAQVTDAATSSQHPSADFTASFIVFSTAPVPIHKVQGSGLASPYAGYPVTVQGVVVASYQAAGQIGGFYIQTPDAQQDGNPATSEGILVYDNTNSVTVGDLVTVTGTVLEFGTAPATGTEITTLTAFTKNGVAALPAAVPVNLPFPSATYTERYEGMRVTLPQTLTVTNNYDYGIFGEVVLSSNGLLPNPTNIVAPGAPAQAVEAANRLNQIALDDGIGGNFPDPTPYLADSAGKGLTRRTGSTVTGLTAILDTKFGGYILEPTGPVAFADANPRTNAPVVAGTLKVAIGNVLNFFNGDGFGGGFPTSRGATNYPEYLRQRAKIVAGITALKADIMGLTELENDGFGPSSAIADLVNGLNAAAPSGTTYAYVNAAAVNIVTDVIHCGFIYRVETVAPVGAPAMLSHVSYNNLARNPLAQTFRQLSNNAKLTVSINHFRAKASVAPGAGNADQGDGQGNNNALRLQQANALTAWLATDPTGSGDPDFLIIGDLNAYAKEDPIAAIENAGYINLTEVFEGVGGYSYQFGGTFGHLDHALASDSLADQVVGAATWHVNSDEPIYYDYNTEDKSLAQQAINATGAYRYSDHDPVVVGLNLTPPPAAEVTSSLQITRGSLALNRKTGRYGQTVTIKNISAQAIAAPLSFVITQLSANGTAYAPAGYTTVVPPLNSPYYNVSVGADNLLTPNETVSFTIEYTNSNTSPITYVPKVLAGPGGR